MKCLNLLDIEENLNQGEFSHLIRVDNIYVGSKVLSKDQVELVKRLGVESAVDLKARGETEFEDQKEFEALGINYVHLPVTDLEKVDFELVKKLGECIQDRSKKVLVYCASGNRVGALLALHSYFVCGHPVERSFEFGVKVGLSREGSQKTVKDRLSKGWDRPSF